MNTLTISSLFCTFVALTFAAITAFKSTKEKQYRWFTILCATISLWNLFFFFAHIFNSILLERVHLLLTLVLAPCSAYFFLQVIDRPKNFTLIYKALAGAPFCANIFNKSIDCSRCIVRSE